VDGNKDVPLFIFSSIDLSLRGGSKPVYSRRHFRGETHKRAIELANEVQVEELEAWTHARLSLHLTYKHCAVPQARAGYSGSLHIPTWSDHHSTITYDYTPGTRDGWMVLALLCNTDGL
jgi:hypothetical protein